jgi:hypothetical protein
MKMLAAVLIAAAFAAPAAAATPPVAVRDGYLVNFTHRYYMPLASDWKLGKADEAEADYQSLAHAKLAGTVMQILVATDSRGGLDETVAALREKAGEEPRTRVLRESKVRVGVREAREVFTLREPAAAGDPVVLVRTVVFLKGQEKYYVRLEAPASSFEKASADFDEALAGLKFEFKIFPGSGKDEP